MGREALRPRIRARCWLGLLAGLLGSSHAAGRNLLQADGPGGTYDLLRTAYTVEVPDCGHMVQHISEAQDAELGRPVFVFELHVAEDDDRCTATDRQRAEIRAHAEDIVASEGETVHYAWKFKLDAGFQGTPNFTHIFQIKSDESPPVMTLTPRVDTMAIDGRIGVRGSTELQKFLGAWVQVELRVLYAEAGELAMTIRRVDDSEVLFDYSGDADMWDANASGHDSKFGLYRSLSSAGQLRDEQVRFADFCASKVSAAECANLTMPDPGVGGAAGNGGTMSAGGTPSAGSAGLPAGGSAGSDVTGGSGQGGSPATPPGSAGRASGAGTSGIEPGGEPNSTESDASAGCACRLPATPRSVGRAGLLLLAACSTGLGLRRRHRRRCSDWNGGS
jgi:hypothetical protein